MKNKNTTFTVAVTLALTLIGKILGLLRDRMLAVNYGTGMLANAFLTASRVPRVFFDAIFASAIAMSFIPVFSAVGERDGRERALRFGSEFTNLAAVVTFVVSALGMLLAAPITRLFAKGYDAETLTLATQLTRVMFPTVFLTGIAFSFVGILQSLESFTVPAAISVVSNGIIIIYYVLFNDRFGIFGLATVFLIGWAAQAIIMIPALAKVGYRPHRGLGLNSPDMREVGRLMLPVMVSAWVQPVCLAIGTRFASSIDGGVTAIELSMNLYLVIIGVFVLSVTNVLFPRISRIEAAGGSIHGTVRASLGASLYFAIPVMCGVAVLAGPMISVIYGGGEFSGSAISITAGALRYSSLGMVGYTVSAILGRVYFARHETRPPLIAGIVAIAANAALCAVLTKPLGVDGIAIASSVSITLNAVLLLIPLVREGLLSGQFSANILKMSVCAIIMTVAAYSLTRLPALAERAAIVQCAVIAVIGAAVYFISSALLHTDEAAAARTMLTGLLHRNNAD